MSYKGEPHHFYRLEPEEDAGDKRRLRQGVDSMMVINEENMGHYDNTYQGHAFVFAQRTANHDKQDGDKASTSVSGESMSVSDDDDDHHHSHDSMNLIPPAKVLLAECLPQTREWRGKHRPPGNKY